MLLVCKHINQFKYILEYIHSFNNECNFHFKEDGLYMQILDKECDCYLDIHIEKDTFNKYECKNEEIIGIDINNLLTIVRIHSNYNTFEMSTFCSNKLEVIFKMNRKKSKWTMNLLDIQQDNLLTEPFKYTIIKLDSSSFYKTLSDLDIFMDTMTIEYKHNKLIMKGKSNMNEVTITNNLNKKQIISNKCPSVTIRFSLNKLKKLCNVSNITDSIQLSITSNKPLRIYSNFTKMIGNISCYIAPESI